MAAVNGGASAWKTWRERKRERPRREWSQGGDGPRSWLDVGSIRRGRCVSGSVARRPDVGTTRGCHVVRRHRPGMAGVAARQDLFPGLERNVTDVDRLD